MTENEQLEQIEESIAAFKQKFPNLEAYGNECIDQEGQLRNDSLKIYFVPEHKEVFLNLLTVDSIEKYQSILESGFRMHNSVFGLMNDNSAEIIVHSINESIDFADLTRKNVSFKMRYKGVDILAEFLEYNSGLNAFFVYEHLWAARMRNVQILRISGLQQIATANIDDCVVRIANSLLFDISVTYDISLAYIRCNDLTRSGNFKFSRVKLEENKTLNLIYKGYSNELLIYYNTAESIRYPPFRFLCFYQIIEYYLDKSAYLSAKNKLENIINKPDYHVNRDKYISEVVNYIRQENNRSTSDKLKIRRVIENFVNKDEIREILERIKALEHFEEECVFECGENLSLMGIDFESANKFSESVTNRIYSLRCSIVHSNPEFDKKFAIPFVPSRENLNKLKSEMELTQIIAQQIIVKSVEYDT